MGSLYLSQYVAGNCTGLSCRAYRVLLRMALVVYDEDTPPGADNEGLYFGGWKGLTASLGYGIFEGEDELPAHVERTIARAVKELRDAGYLSVAPARLQREHWNRVYRLSLMHFPLV
jgi:hypothetical protein